MPTRPLDELVHPSWVPALRPHEATLAALGEFLREEVAAGRGYLPAGQHVLRAFELPLDDVRVLIVGQDPYPTPGHPIGLSFAVAPDVQPVPRSLANIFTELGTDLGLPRPSTGDLTPWAERGVMLLNRVLTVSPRSPASHRGKGWEDITPQDRDARGLRGRLQRIPCIESAHPSPLSAHSGFLGSRPFSRANDHLRRLGADPIDWRLP